LAFKGFLPRFFTKKRAGSRGGAPAARRSARNAPCANAAQEGVKGGTLAGGPPFAGGSAARSPCDTAGPAVNEGKGRRGRRPLQGWCGDTGSAVIPRPGGGRRNAVGLAKTVTAGRRGRRPLQGWCDTAGPAIIPRRAGVEPRPYGAGGT